MSEVKRFRADHRHVVETEFDDAQFVGVADFDRVTAERDAMQVSLATADEWSENLRSALISAKADKEAYAQNAIDLRKRVDALQALLTAADERADVLEGLLLQTNELLYAIQGDPGAVPSSSIDSMRGKVFEALKQDKSTSVLHPQNL